MNTVFRMCVTTLSMAFAVGCATNPTAMNVGSVYQISCNELDEFASVSDEEKYIINFLNSRNTAVNMFWINYEGVEVFYSSMDPGETFSQNTFMTHPWVVRNSEGDCLAAYNSANKILVDIL